MLDGKGKPKGHRPFWGFLLLLRQSHILTAPSHRLGGTGLGLAASGFGRAGVAGTQAGPGQRSQTWLRVFVAQVAGEAGDDVWPPSLIHTDVAVGQDQWDPILG